MAVYCDEEDADALDFEKNTAGDSINADCWKRQKEQSRYFEWMFCAGSRTRVSVQVSEAGSAWSLITSEGTG